MIQAFMKDLHRFALVLACALSLWAGINFAPAARQVNVVVHTTATYLHNFDVSRWQGYLSLAWWQGAKNQGNVSTEIKASGGDGGGYYVDPQFSNNWHNARAVGMLRSAYYFMDPSWSPNTQANDFVATVKSQGFYPGDSCMLDAEYGSYDWDWWMSTWLNSVAGQLGVRCLVYTNEADMSAHMPGRASYGICPSNPLDLAFWTSLFPGTPGCWTYTTVWQYGSNGSVNGLYPVDVDYQLAVWPGLGGASSPPPPPTTSGCNFGTSTWTASPWWNGDGNQQTTMQKYGGSVACSNAQFSYGIQSWNGSYWQNVCSASLGTCWDGWTTRTSDFWNLSYYATPCNRAYRGMVAIRSGTGAIAGYKQIGSWKITIDCA